MTDMLAGVLIAAGTIFYLAGSIGLLRLPDTYCRLHALTKADNLGLGLLVAGRVELAAGQVRQVIEVPSDPVAPQGRGHGFDALVHDVEMVEHALDGVVLVYQFFGRSHWAPPGFFS